MTTVRSLSTTLERAPAQIATPRRSRRWLRQMTLPVALSFAILIVLLLAVLLADVLATANPTAINLRARLQPPFQTPVEGADYFLLGTDATGRDIFSRLLHGGRVSLFVGGVATVLGLVFGVGLGLISGFARGWLDELIMYFVDVQLSLPFVLLAVAVALVLGRSLPVLVGLAALSTWPVYARVVRGEVLSLREREFVVAARAMGAGAGRIMWAHLLPNVLASVLVLGTINIGRIILLESALSYLGIGIQPPTPSWGTMINEGRDYLSNEWWLSTLPALALMLLTLAVGTIGDWLRDVLDVTVG